MIHSIRNAFGCIVVSSIHAMVVGSCKMAVGSSQVEVRSLDIAGAAAIVGDQRYRISRASCCAPRAPYVGTKVSTSAKQQQATAGPTIASLLRSVVALANGAGGDSIALRSALVPERHHAAARISEHTSKRKNKSSDCGCGSDGMW